MSITIHLIANAHLDPVWLWPWQAGLDEAIATCRSACDRLDAHPDLVFTRGEAWVYKQIEQVDPALFERIRAHVAAGRWEIVGGWWIQPDCNLPSGFGLRKQIELGREYFQSRFDCFPEIAYNVDSFGHTAALPQIMRDAGQRCYVMMRPQESEMDLPARLFRWRGHEGGPEVTTFRIAGAYTCRNLSLEFIQKSLTALPDGIHHTMCFFGVGNHGGGPTEANIAWLREHWNAVTNVQFEFSSPSRFFKAIENQIPSLPLVTGELQQHAIGCYSVYRPIKTAVRRAENLLEQVQNALPDSDFSLAWEKVCFAHFHDTLGGSSIPSAYPQQLDLLGYAATVADQALQLEFRRCMNELPRDTRQRIVAWNPSKTAFAGPLEFEPWLDWQDWHEDNWLSDASGAPVPFQRMHSESMVFQNGTPDQKTFGLPRLVFRGEVSAENLSFWHIERGAKPELNLDFTAPEIDFAAQKLRFDKSLPLPQLALIEDTSDTWSHLYHNPDRKNLSYGEAGECAQFSAPQMVDDGPLLRSWLQDGSIGQSRLQAEWRVYHGEAFIELRLRVHWQEKHRLLKLTWPIEVGATRTDGISGGQLQRPSDGRELPLRDWTHCDSGAIVAPDVFALDAAPNRLRLTLLRSPLLAHHDPHSGSSPRARVADQGEHEFTFRFFAATNTATLEAHAAMLQRPPLLADLTRGMKAS